MAVKYVFVTGGVVSGLGKGITAASLGRLLKARGYTVTMQKFDPYINIDPGTMNPVQHGEVFVTPYRSFFILQMRSKANSTGTLLLKALKSPLSRSEAQSGILRVSLFSNQSANFSMRRGRRTSSSST